MDSRTAQSSVQTDHIQEVPLTVDLLPPEVGQSKGTHTDPLPPSSPYTLFTPSHRRLIVVILILTMLASPLTATIYLPLLPLLAAHFHVSLQAINLTLTLYIVFQAISPLLFATASDSFGRRPSLSHHLLGLYSGKSWARAEQD
ncbi:hypothetical protein XPA_008361 [Xanthoria parietina]